MAKNSSLSSAGYSPGIAPVDAEQFRRWVEEELRKIASTFLLVSSGHIDVTYVPPAKPREGDIRLADGSTWNPGSGKGAYIYYGSAWHYLG